MPTTSLTRAAPRAANATRIVFLAAALAGGATLSASASGAPAPGASPAKLAAAEIDRLIEAGNAQADTSPLEAGEIGDLAFLRRVTIDLIGRIPTYEEVRAFQALPEGERRPAWVDRLLEDPRFADRWTVFFADMLRVRTGAPGGQALLAYVHRSVAEGKPYDEMARDLIAANGRTQNNPAVGFILGDNADPMALAGATAQVFLGVRIACAQCHNHPFDDWKQKQFYELAGYFGKTQRVENRFTRGTYTTEGNEMRVQWPPEDKVEKLGAPKPVDPTFPFELASFKGKGKPGYIARLEAKRAAAGADARDAADAEATAASLDDLLDSAGASAHKTAGPGGFDVLGEAARAKAEINLEQDLYRASELRADLAQLVTDPRNRYFAKAFVNRAWAELVGRGFVEPLDDLSPYVETHHPEAFTRLAEEFVAEGYDLRSLIRTIVSTRAYARGHLEADAPTSLRDTAERAFTASPMRRMLSEVLFDSIIVAGHLSDHKWPKGANLRTETRRERVEVPVMMEGEDGGGSTASNPAAPAPPEPVNSPASAPGPSMNRMMAAGARPRGGYDLETGIELDFDALLKGDNIASELAMMKQMSDQEIEAQKMAEMARQNRPRKYTYRTVTETFDDNPRYDPATRMATPAPPAHFLRVFGQPSRDGLGEFREQAASLRQALMMLNGKLTHEAARVGPLEPLHRILSAGKKERHKAVRRAYLEILTREPTTSELREAHQVMDSAPSPHEGMADLRWALLNCHEFRFLP